MLPHIKSWATESPGCHQAVSNTPVLRRFSFPLSSNYLLMKLPALLQNGYNDLSNPLSYLQHQLR